MSLTPSTDELVALGAPVVLRDGSRVRLRQGRSSDRQLLLRGFERLSPDSRYRRFLAAMPELSKLLRVAARNNLVVPFEDRHHAPYPASPAQRDASLDDTHE